MLTFALLICLVLILFRNTETVCSMISEMAYVEILSALVRTVENLIYDRCIKSKWCFWPLLFLFRSLHKRNWYTSCECSDQLRFPQTRGDVPPSHWQIRWVRFCFGLDLALRSSNVAFETACSPSSGFERVAVLMTHSFSPHRPIWTLGSRH